MSEPVRRTGTGSRSWRPLARLAVPARREQPLWVPPMLASLAEPRACPAGWLYEPKLDGIRCLAFVRAGRARLYSRNRKLLNGAFPELVEALSRQSRGEAILDGEIVAIDPASGISSFSLLQQRMQLRDPARARRTGIEVELWLFDCPFYEGLDLAALPLEDRKRVLRDAVQFAPPIRNTPTYAGPFEALYREACRAGAEGLVAKRAASRYVGRRSTDWLKLKCVTRQEFVVGGWTEPKGSREVLGALLVGYHDEAGHLRYAGKVGTGYTRAALAELGALLARRSRPSSPFAAEAGPRPEERGTHWVRPEVVVEVGFTEWTSDGVLRHPRFLGLRRDRDPREVVRER